MFALGLLSFKDMNWVRTMRMPVLVWGSCIRRDVNVCGDVYSLSHSLRVMRESSMIEYDVFDTKK